MNANDLDSCLNCGAQLQGPFCHQCGQAKSAKLVPVKEWIGDFLESLVELDSKLLRTLKRVLFYPGMATVDFTNGKRVSYTNPFKVYIIVSAVSIAAMSFQGLFAVQAGQVQAGAEMDQELIQRVQLLFPFGNLLSPFLTAFLMKLVQPKNFYQLHLTYSLHFWSFFIAGYTPLIFLPPNQVLGAVANLIFIAWFLGYVYAAHRRVYSMRFVRRIFCYMTVIGSVVLAAIVINKLIVQIASLL
ncbi:MAG: DUF3667 domain-containing protein [Planctomycetota bacterium]